jgi:vancomycin permeability regulator SanA
MTLTEMCAKYKGSLYSMAACLIGIVMGYATNYVDISSYWKPDIDAAIEVYHQETIVPLIQAVDDNNKGIVHDEKIQESPSDRSYSGLRVYN